MIQLTINGEQIEVQPGTTVLQACEKMGIEIPRFCYHEKLSITGSCRMCLVEVEKMPRLMPSCDLLCADGMVVHTDTPAVTVARQDVMEMLLINHPLDCPVCDQGGECDLQDEAFAYGCDRCRTKETRRLVSDKELGPLIKTVMTRCIHCTRCTRFMDEVAGSPELGAFFRGEKMEIAPLGDGPLRSELSGNLVDVCPVGALTSKPYAFRARPWELKHTDSIDVMDAVGSAIRIDTRGDEIMRIVPRRHEGINEVWISDRTRFAFDGLAHNRLDRPWLRDRDGQLQPVSWDAAIEAVARRLMGVAPSRVAALVGDKVDCETIFAFKQLLDNMDVPHRDCRFDGTSYDVSAPCSYVMNSTIAGIDHADALLLVGTNPRHEATMINARIHKKMRAGGLKVGLVGAPADLTYPYEQVGHSPVSLRDLLEGKNGFGKILRDAQRPMLLLGAGALARNDGAAIHAAAYDLAESFGLVRKDWNGFNVLQLAASRVGGLDLGFVPQSSQAMTGRAILLAAMGDRIDVLYLMGADELDPKRLGQKTFVIYQGHHGDRAAQRADVILPSTAFTEKTGTYVNTEGRAQRAFAAVPPVGEAREDWRILQDIGNAIGRGPSYASYQALYQNMLAAHPSLAATDEVHPRAWTPFGQRDTLSLHPFSPVLKSYYMTDSISRASPTMQACHVEIEQRFSRDGGWQ